MLVPSAKTSGPLARFFPPLIAVPFPRLQQRTPLPQIPDAANPTLSPKEASGGWVSASFTVNYMGGGLPAQREPLKCEHACRQLALADTPSSNLSKG